MNEIAIDLQSALRFGGVQKDGLIITLPHTAPVVRCRGRTPRLLRKKLSHLCELCGEAHEIRYSLHFPFHSWQAFVDIMLKTLRSKVIKRVICGLASTIVELCASIHEECQPHGFCSKAGCYFFHSKPVNLHKEVPQQNSPTP